MRSEVSSNELRISDLGCVRGRRQVFDGLTFQVSNGDLLQIQGVNGSGKTSLLRVLSGLMAPDAGQVLWNATDIHRSRNEHYHRASQYVGHKNGVADDLSAIENLNFACGMRGLIRDDVDRSPQQALRRIGFDGAGDRPAAKLSAGQKQRLALARLYLLDLPLWLLDEPFTALDSAGKALVEMLLLDHCHAGGIAIIATHQLLETNDSCLKTLAL